MNKNREFKNLVLFISRIASRYTEESNKQSLKHIHNVSDSTQIQALKGNDFRSVVFKALTKLDMLEYDILIGDFFVVTSTNHMPYFMSRSHYYRLKRKAMENFICFFREECSNANVDPEKFY